MQHKKSLPRNNISNNIQSRGYWNIHTSNNLIQKEKRNKIETDNQLLDYILKQMGSSLNQTRTELIKFIKEALNMDSNYPRWVSKLINDNYDSILSSIKDEESLFNIEFLTIVCYFFKLRIEISYEISSIKRFKGFGDKRYKRFSFMLRDGEYIEKESGFKYQHKQVKEESKKKKVNYSRLVEEKSENFNIINTMNQTVKNRSLFTYKNLSNIDKNPLNTSIHSNYNEEESINKINQQTEFRKEGLGEKELSCSLQSNSLPKPKSTKEGKKYEDTLQTALDFIKQYQITVKTKEINNNTDKKYKSVVLGKSDRFYQGTLKFYNEQKKFGFILLSDDKEIFIHKDNIVRSKIDTKAFEICSHFFTIILQFRLLHYQGRKNNNIKAIDLEILNFIPKTSSK